MRGFYVFMMWLFSITTWKNIMGVIFAKIWSMVTVFGHVAPTPEHKFQDEANSIHQQNLPDHEDLETLLSELTDVKSLWIDIRPHLSHEKFIFRGRQAPDDRILAQTEDQKTYFAVLDHISSSKTMNKLHMTLWDYREPHSVSEHRQKELVNHLEAFQKALASNKSLEDVSAFVRSSYGGDHILGYENVINQSGVGIANWIAKVLFENKTISKLRLHFDGALSIEAAQILSRALFANHTLKTLYLSQGAWFGGIPLICGEAMKILLQPFSGIGDKYNNVLEHLSLDCRSDDNGVEQIAAMLMVNNSLKRVCFRRNDKSSKNGISKIGDALSINRSLQKLKLYLMILHPDEFKGLLKPLMQDDAGFQANTSLKSLNLVGCEIGQVGFEYLIAMIEQNKSLIDLNVYRIYVLGDGHEENVCLLLDSLKGHPSIKNLSLCGNKGVDSDKVLGTFMDLLLENNHLQEVDLLDTPLSNSGDAEKIYTELKWRRKENSQQLIKNMTKVHAKSGRIFLCGDGEAGKTTLCATLKETCEIKKYSKMESSQSKIPFSFSQTKMDSNERTRGIEVHNLSYYDLDLTIWDMAGQEEFHSFHDLVIPNLSGAGSSCAFILVCNPLQYTSDEIKSRLQYWLQFIASNTRKSRLYRPHVTIIMTHYDLWCHEGPLFTHLLEEEVKALKEEFKDLLEFDIHKNFYPMDVRQSNEITMELFEFMIDQMKNLLAKLPKVLKACFDLQKMVKDRNINHPNQPFLSWDAFSSICEQIEELKVTSAKTELVERRRKFVALSLHDGGHIIYNEDIHLVILNPHWFCHDVMGELLSHFNVYLKHPNLKIASKGSITSATFKQILSSLNIVGDEHHAYNKDFISILTKLQICYDQGDDTFMVPSTLPQKRELLKWPSFGDTTKHNYIGRRLAPRDIKHTILSAGFFPRLQVYFQGKTKDDNTRKSYKLTKDTIFFISNGKEVFIEYDGHIDVMVRSIENKDVLLQFLHEEVFTVIYELLRNPTLGCPGVVLVECVLRPSCVRKLIRKEHRKDQFVLLESLKSEVLKCYDLNYCHNWDHSEELELEQGYDNATSLLGREEWTDVLRRRRKALKEIGTQVLSNLASTSMTLNSNDRGTNDNEPGAEAQNIILSRIHSLKKIVVGNHLEIKSDLEEIKSNLEEIKSIIRQQDQMLYGISASINESMQFSVELQRSQIPRLAYLTEKGKKQFLTRMIPKLRECNLHFFCEHIYGIHRVDGQQGYPLCFGTKDTKKVICLIARGLKVATILVKVAAHVGGGMGSLVPDLAQGASLMLDTPGLLDHRLPDFSSLHILSEELGEDHVIRDEDKKDAEQWLIKKVNSRSDEIYDMFKLNKVKYNRLHFGDQMKIPSIAWVCDKHKSDGLRSGILESLSEKIQL